MEANSKLKSTYEAQASAYKRTIEALEKQLKESESDREAEFQDIRDKYSRLTAEEMSSLKNTHTNEIQFLFQEIAQLRAGVDAYNSKLEIKDHEISTVKQSYEREISMNTSEINTLNKKIIQLEEEKLREIRDLTNRRELEKSRTSGMVNSRKETTQYIEKQLRKLNEEVLEKTIGIENISRELNKEKKKHEETTKNMNKKIDALTEDYEAQLAEKEQHYTKIEKILKDEILEYKSKEIRLLNENESLRSSTNVLKKEIDSKDAVIKSKSEDILQLKATIEKNREDHINEINNLMKERRKRSSKSNLGSSQSLGSSLKESALIASTPEASENISRLPSFLPIVKEESSPERRNLSDMSQSNIMEDENENENELARAIYHYDTVIDELKKSHEIEVEFFKMSLDKSAGRLKEKELELEDVLTRFSPLVKIHADEKSLEEDRQERLERHWKADLALLEIMLRKYRIRTF